VVIDYLWGMPVAAATQNAAVGARIVQVGGVRGDSAALSAMAIRAQGIDLLGFAGYLAPREARVAAYRQQVELAAGRLELSVNRVGLDTVEAQWTARGGAARTVLIP